MLLLKCRNDFESNLVLPSDRIFARHQRLDVLGHDPVDQKTRSNECRNRESEEGKDGQVSIFSFSDWSIIDKKL